ncbi:MAG: methyltransferase domain-containing protein [Myxococcota bacterium]
MDYRGIRLRYRLETKHLDVDLREAFVELDADASTRSWIDQALDAPQSRRTTTLREVAKQFVGFYDANAIANAFSMRVLSTEQYATLLPRAAGVSRSVLDIGAGDGEVTAELSPLFSTVVTTELAPSMARRLRKGGYTCHSIDIALERFPPEAMPDREGFDLVALQNVIDRTSFPLRLLRRAAELRRSEGRLFVTVPLPIRQVVFAGPVVAEASEQLPTGARRWEHAASDLYRLAFAHLGFEVERFSRAPYLCRGDDRAPVEALDGAVFVLR